VVLQLQSLPGDPTGCSGRADSHGYIYLDDVPPGVVVVTRVPRDGFLSNFPAARKVVPSETAKPSSRNTPRTCSNPPGGFQGSSQGIHREIGSEGFAPSPAGRPILRESIEGEFRARVASIEIIDETEYARRGGVVACTVEVAR